jgi:hypothetical protein
MLIIADKKMPAEAKKRLREVGNLMELETRGITYDAISGHPDIFFTQAGNRLIAAPNLPDVYQKKLAESGVVFIKGEKAVGASYPETAMYNAVVSDNLLVHNLDITDAVVRLAAGQRQQIHVNQGYTRCNLLFIAPGMAISSDKKICDQLIRAGIKMLYFDPSHIRLPGFSNGFVGGACGMFNNTLFIAGNLRHHTDGDPLKQFCAGAGVAVTELCDEPLFDGGGILFIMQKL